MNKLCANCGHGRKSHKKDGCNKSSGKTPTKLVEGDAEYTVYERAPCSCRTYKRG